MPYGLRDIAMSGPMPKNPAVRQRTNKVAGRATLAAEPEKSRRVPPLPKFEDKEGQAHQWNALTRQWWRDVWKSPMASEYLQADVHGLYRLAILIDKFWGEPNQVLAAEIRLEQQCFGLTPIDRRRLQWEVERAEDATRKTQRRERAEAEPIEDPRSVLRLVG